MSAKKIDRVTAVVIDPDAVRVGGSLFRRDYGKSDLGCGSCGRAMPMGAAWCPWCGARARGGRDEA